MMWKEKYKIGVPLIDTQHQELFNRVSHFIQAIRTDGAWQEKLPEVTKTLQFMQEYVISHFADEERFQAEINYPERENHQEIHREFKKAVNGYAIRLQQEEYPEELTQEFAGKLMTWLIRHVAATDQELGKYVRGQGGVTSES